jgi:hypothetical protein
MKFDFKKFLVLHKDKIDKIKNFILIVLGYGLLINYALLIIIDVPLLWYGFPAFGITYYFIMEEFVTFFRKLKAKTYT